jgi:hypothetical protein
MFAFNRVYSIALQPRRIARQTYENFAQMQQQLGSMVVLTLQIERCICFKCLLMLGSNLASHALMQQP